MKLPLYPIFGTLVLLLTSLGQWRGVQPFSSVNELKNIPKSVRENPGVYRSHYSWLPHWFGGK